MYVASTPSGLIVKRMPGSATDHAAECASWEPPAGLSGLGEVIGEAITDNPETGMTALRLGFALSQSAGRAAPDVSAGADAESVSTDGHKLTLRALLHYLWDEAGLTSWSPRMAGRRNWRVVSWHLRQAAHGKTAKRQALDRKLFIPEPFDAEHKRQLLSRRHAAWKAAQSVPGKTTQLLLLVGEIKAIEEARYGYKLVVKHLPDTSLVLAEDVHKRLRKHFADELDGWAGDDASHLMMIGTFLVNNAGIAVVRELSVMLVDEHWLPVESGAAKMLLSTAIDERRRFRVCLRYNLSRTAASATLVFTDTDPTTAAFIDDSVSLGDAMSAAADHADNTASPIPDGVEGMAVWSWLTATEMPELPEPARIQPQRTAL